MSAPAINHSQSAMSACSSSSSSTSSSASTLPATSEPSSAKTATSESSHKHSIDFTHYSCAYQNLALNEYPSCVQATVEKMRWLVDANIECSTKNFLGKGAYGSVYGATYESRDKTRVICVVKVFDHPGYSDQSNGQACEQEVCMLWKTIGVTHAIGLHGVTSTIPNFLNVIALDYIEGPDLSDLPHHLPVEEVIQLAKQLFTYLKELQTPAANRKFPLVHCDLKRTNLFWIKRQLVVIDLSIMTEANAKCELANADGAQIPEILFKGDGQSIATNSLDVWAAASIIHHLIILLPLVQAKDSSAKQISTLAQRLGMPSAAYLERYKNASKYFAKEGSVDATTVTNSDNQAVDSLEKLHQESSRSNPQLFDLLQKALRWQPEERITIEDALKHPLFKDVNS